MWAKLTLIYSKGHLQHDSMPFYPPSIALYDIFARACAEIKILTYVFFAFLFFALILSVCCSAWLTFDWACFHFKTFRESIIETGNFYHEIATCSRRKFCSVVCHSNTWAFSCIFQVPLGRSLYLSINGKIIFSCRTWVWLMPILIRGDDVRSGTKAKARHGRLRPANLVPREFPLE